MGMSYSIFTYPKKKDNYDYATEWGMLPNRYENLDDLYCNGKGDYPLGKAFGQLLLNKAGKSDYSQVVLSWVKVEPKDKAFIIKALSEMDDDQFGDAYATKQDYINLANELFARIDQGPEYDYYFKWS